MADPTAAVTAVAGPPPLPPGRRPRHRAAGESRLPRIAPDALGPLVAVLAVALAGARTLGGPPLPDDDALTAPAFALLHGDTGLSLLSPDGLGAAHTAVYATATGAFARHDTLIGAGREMLLVLLVVSALLVWRTSRRLGLGHPAAATAVVAFGSIPWLVPAHAVSTPAAWAVPWALLGCRLALARRPAPATWTVAALAILLAVLLSPDVLLLISTGLAGALPGHRLRRPRPQLFAIGATAALIATAVAVRLLLPRWDPQVDNPARWSTDATGLVGAGAVLLLIGLLALWSLPRLRGPGMALAATTLLAVMPPSGRLPAFLLCLPVAAVLLGGLLEHAARSLIGTRHGRARALRVEAAVAVVAAVLAAGVGLATAPGSDFGATARADLVVWAREQLPPEGRLSAEERTAAELLHAGADPQAMTAATDAPVARGRTPVVLRVVAGSPPQGSAPVARFDGEDGLPALTVVAPRPAPPGVEELDSRRVLGQALAANPDTMADEQVRARLERGDVDPRLLSVLAGIGAQSGIGLAGFSDVPAEQGWTLVRQAVVESVGGVRLDADAAQADRLLALLRAQRPPYTPDVVRLVPGGVLVGYRYAPDPDVLLTRAAGR